MDNARSIGVDGEPAASRLRGYRDDEHFPKRNRDGLGLIILFAWTVTAR